MQCTECLDAACERLADAGLLRRTGRVLNGNVEYVVTEAGVATSRARTATNGGT